MKLFILDEPTIGVDVGAKAEIYRFLKDLTEPRRRRPPISSELPEVLNLSNRVYVIHQGRVVRHLEGDRLTETDALSGFFGE